jgi:putative Mg2+ transporter-C (MgtC) family protein
MIATVFVIGVNLVLRPLVTMIGRRPISMSDADAAYEISIICHGEAEAHVRALLLRDLGSTLYIRDLESSNIEDSSRVEVAASVRADGRQDRMLEQIVGRRSLEPLVTAAGWRLSAVE